MKILYIRNSDKSHCEIIESIIVKHEQIIKKKVDIIYLLIKENRNFKNSKNFKKYIKSKYPKIIFEVPKKYDYFIECTIYEKDYNLIKNKNPDKHFYISHRVCKIYNNMKNVYCLTPLSNNYIYADILPYSNLKKQKTEYPIFCIQGVISKKRRNHKLLHLLLNHKTQYKFKIKIIGMGKLPPELTKYKEKIILKSNLDFIDYHKEFLDCYCLLPLISKKTNPNYYDNQLTSSISYARGYSLKCLIDKDLQNIYNLPDVEIFINEHDICNKFENVLKDFYEKSNIYLGWKLHFNKIGNKIVSNKNTIIKKDIDHSYVLENEMKKNINIDSTFKIINEYEKYYVLDINSIQKKINLIYFKCKENYGNFGDELSKFIVSSLINTNKYELVYNQLNIETNVVGIGSYIHSAKNNSYIFGSGVRTNPPIEKGWHTYKNLKVCSVRGPLTKDFLEDKNIKVPDVFGDPALLLPKFYIPNIDIKLKNKIGIIPHKSNYAKYKNIKLDSKYLLISPTDRWQNIINSICSCKCIISSSLHGLICSDAYKIPNIWLDEFKLIEGHFKFKDYFLSQGRKFINIKKLNDFKDELLYKDGNKIDLDKLKNSFPFN